MTENERRPHIPEWAEQERLGDLAWIVENLSHFWSAAQSGYEQAGRGAIVVDTMIQPDPEQGNPMLYFGADELANLGFSGSDEARMVAQYNPDQEFVTILLKQADRVSAYRVGVPGVQGETDRTAP